MSLFLYNTLTKNKEEFKPIKDDIVNMYTCGPTVYNYPHIGNYRAYIFVDTLKRTLLYLRYNTKHVMNITDVDDKTIRDSIKENKTLKELTEYYTDEFFKDLKSLNIIPANKYTKATDYIDEMVKLSEILINKGFAYKSNDGSIYFNIRKDKEYGKLSHFELKELKENADNRIKNDEYDKENAEDFALWKSWDKNDGDIFWDTSLGKGRPGWHIECSAMSMKEFGPEIDIHTGGVDLIFPHHENEIAQSECTTGKQFVKYWLHNEHLMVDGKKMSKSFGNFYTLRDLINKGIDPLAFRYWIYTGHYRTQVNFTQEAISASQKTLKKLKDFYASLGDTNNQGKVSLEYKKELVSVLEDDLNMPRALSILWSLINDSNITDVDKKATILDFDKIFGFGLDGILKKEIPENILKLAKDRNDYRKNKNWAKSDEFRKQINNLGYNIKDTGEDSYVISPID